MNMQQVSIRQKTKRTQRVERLSECAERMKKKMYEIIYYNRIGVLGLYARQKFSNQKTNNYGTIVTCTTHGRNLNNSE